MSMSLLLLSCSVCGGEYNTKQSWLHHLLKTPHKSVARSQIIGWSRKVRQQCLFVFARFPVASFELLQEFSKGEDFITDFVWSPKLPKIGVLQFESKEKAEEMFEKVGSARLLNGELFQLRKGKDLLGLEWESIFDNETSCTCENDDNNSDGVNDENDNEPTPTAIPDSPEGSGSDYPENEDVQSEFMENESYLADFNVLKSGEGFKIVNEVGTIGDEVINESKQPQVDAEECSRVNGVISTAKNYCAGWTPIEVEIGAVKMEIVSFQAFPNFEEHENRASGESNAMDVDGGTHNEGHVNPLNSPENTKNPAWDADTLHLENAMDVFVNENEDDTHQSNLDADDTNDKPLGDLGQPNQIKFEFSGSVVIESQQNDEKGTPSTSQTFQDSTSSCTHLEIDIAQANIHLVPYPSSPSPASDPPESNNDDSSIITAVKIKQEPKNLEENSNSMPDVYPANVDLLMPPPPPPPPTERICLDTAINKQFNAIYREVAITNDEYDKAQYITKKLEEVLKHHFPSCKVYMFRHWYLWLKNMGTNELLFYLDLEDAISGNSQFAPAGVVEQTIKEIMRTQYSQSILPCKRRLFQKTPEFGLTYLCKNLNVEFSLAVEPDSIVEVQTCRVLEFLCHFDPRALPLLSLVTCWAKINNIRLSAVTCGKDITPEPAALEWLVMFFLIYKRIVPTPREIVDDHQKTTFIFYNDVDIGFNKNFELSHKWSQNIASTAGFVWENYSDIIISVLTLAEEFFSFYHNLLSESWILNTRDGELLSKDKFLYRKRGLGWNTKLTDTEFEQVKQQLYVKNPTVDLKPSIIILHPLDIRVGISFYAHRLVDRRSTMTTTAKRISDFLSLYKEVKDWEQIDLKMDVLFVA